MDSHSGHPARRGLMAETHVAKLVTTGDPSIRSPIPLQGLRALFNFAVKVIDTHSGTALRQLDPNCVDSDQRQSCLV